MIKAKVKKPKVIEYPSKKRNIIDGLIKRGESSETTKWNRGGDEFEVTIKTGGYFKIKFPNIDSDASIFKIEADEKGLKWIKEIEMLESQNITDKDMKNSIFSSVPLSWIQNGDHMKLGKNLMVFKEICKDIQKAGFEQAGFSEKPEMNYSDAAFDKMTIVFSPYNYSGNGCPVNQDILRKYKDYKGYKDPRYNGEKLQKIKDEPEEIINIDKKEIGRYYKERNLVLIWFNPFSRVDLKEVKSYKEIEYVNKFAGDILTAIALVKPTKVNVEKFKIRVLVNSFNKTARKSLSTIKQKYSKIETDIKTYETKIVEWYEESRGIQAQINSLTIIEGEQIDFFLKEVQEAKKQPLVENIQLKDGAVQITFRPSTIKVDMMRTLGDGNNFGIREIYIGRITASLHGDGRITVTCDEPCSSDGNNHPHASIEKPCLGDSEGSRKIKQLAGQRKFSEFVYMFWMWIRRWRPEDCYTKPWVYYDDRLKKGLPIFDQKGNKIKINDEAKIKSGEQLKVKPLACFKENVKKYKDFKPIP